MSQYIGSGLSPTTETPTPEPTPDPTAITQSPTYPESITRFSEYIFVNISMSWQDAEDYCESQYGTNLGTVLTDDQFNAAYDLITQSTQGGDTVFIGLYYDGDTQSFTFINSDIDYECSWDDCCTLVQTVSETHFECSIGSYTAIIKPSDAPTVCAFEGSDIVCRDPYEWDEEAYAEFAAEHYFICDAPITTTPNPTTPAPITPAPVTPAPVTPAPITPAPVTPSPITAIPSTASVTSDDDELSSTSTDIEDDVDYDKFSMKDLFGIVINMLDKLEQQKTIIYENIYLSSEDGLDSKGELTENTHSDGNNNENVKFVRNEIHPHQQQQQEQQPQQQFRKTRYEERKAKYEEIVR